ncbi:hypothetical protein FB567DRAFT_545246 [Paraphoma chrysanthemicola]|uniref:Uncharacterized protein n=1 Tax=Paraphoma chrysanthemicola TaxID=798071 RepID=A0A8K0RFD9_9PLEO|nr:hypothetical protein FB567DRAFT_545246 [Paraphoma chrysanthemicola]
MLSSTILPLLAATAAAQTATILIPDWCITQSAPAVTVVDRDRDLTTYSYSCSTNTSAVSSASVQGSSVAADAKSRASDLKASLKGLKSTDKPDTVHYTVTGIVALDQECSFGAGGVASGAATCTAGGRLDPEVWGRGDGPRTHTFPKSDVDQFWSRETVKVTEAGGVVAGTSVSGTMSGFAEQSRSVVVGGQE